MSEEAAWQRLLCEALTVLSLSPDEQIRVNGPGCISCDLLEDFHHARLVTLANAPDLSEEQRVLLEKIDTTMQVMQPPDLECFNSDVIRRPVWQQLRDLGAETLLAFGWENEGVQPFVEIEPGVWKRFPKDPDGRE